MILPKRIRGIPIWYPDIPLRILVGQIHSGKTLRKKNRSKQHNKLRLYVIIPHPINNSSS